MTKFPVIDLGAFFDSRRFYERKRSEKKLLKRKKQLSVAVICPFCGGEVILKEEKRFKETQERLGFSLKTYYCPACKKKFWQKRSIA